MLIEPEDEGDEHFVDAPEEGRPAASTSKAAPSATDRTYDGKKREPQYAHADSSCLWELVSLSRRTDQSGISDWSDAFPESLPPVCLSPSKPASPFTTTHWLGRHLAQHPRLFP